MDMNDTRLAHPKGRTRKQIKAKKDRTEATIKKLTRAACVVRDGACRLCEWELNPSDWHSDAISGDGCAAYECHGPSEWAHFGSQKRARTRGAKPELRHTTMGSLMLHQSAHRDYDAGRLKIRAVSEDGCDGLLEFRL